MNVNAHQARQVSFIMCKELQSMQTQWDTVCLSVSNKRYVVVQELVMGFVICSCTTEKKHLFSSKVTVF